MKQVISFHFKLTDQFDNVFENSRENDGQPFLILTGSGQLLPAVERHISDMRVGESRSFIIPEDEAYGAVDPSLKLKIPRLKFPHDTDLNIGFQFQGGERDGWPVIYRVTEIDGDDIFADANHELAGLSLHYDVEIIEKREPSADELAHGHAHRRRGVCG